MDKLYTIAEKITQLPAIIGSTIFIIILIVVILLLMLIPIMSIRDIRKRRLEKENLLKEQNEILRQIAEQNKR